MAELSGIPEGIQAGTYRRIAFLGVGNELNGDDAAGVLVIRQILEKLARSKDSLSPVLANFMFIEAGSAPENFTGSLRRFAPDLVIWIDAADFGAEVGSIACFTYDEVDGVSASSHILPPSVLARYLAHELGCEMLLIGIQPEHLDFDRPVSLRVANAIQSLTDWIETTWLA